MYDHFSSDYDRFVNWPARLAAELPFIQAQLASLQPENERPLNILDTACGTGMHAVALAQKGFCLAGADLSASMVNKAHKNAVAAKATIEFQVAGFGELAAAFQSSPAFPFDSLLLCLGNSLPHLLSEAAVQDALQDFVACLRPGGMLLIQNRNFDAIMAKRQRWMDPQYYRDARREWLFVRFYDFEPNGLLAFHLLTLQRDNGADWQQTIASTRLRPLLQSEILDQLAEANFGQIICYGDMSASPFDRAASPNLVITAVR